NRIVEAGSRRKVAVRIPAWRTALMVPVLVALVVAAGWPSTAHAQGRAGREDPAVVSEARGLVRAGNRLFEEKRYEEALQKYRRAFELRPTPNTALNLAATHQALGQLDEAITFARRYLKLAPRARDRRVVQKLIRQLQRERARKPAAPPAAAPAPAPAPPAA